MAKYMEYAEKVFNEYDDLKNENRTLKNILHEIWDILDDPNLDDEDANEKVSLLDIFDELLKEKENMKKDEDESDEDESDEDDKPIKNVLNTTIKNTEEYNIILKEEEDKMFEDADEDETDYKMINKGKFNHEIKEAEKKKNEIDMDKIYSSSDEEEDEKKQLKKEIDKENEEKKKLEEEMKKKKTPFEEEKWAKENNERLIREYLKSKNITTFHHLQEEDLSAYSKYYNFFKIKATPKCYVVKFYNRKSNHDDTTLKTLRFKKP
jgi:hypothetical protein